MSHIVRSHHLLTPFGIGRSAMAVGGASAAAAFGCFVLHLGVTVPWIWAAAPMLATMVVVFPARVDVGGDGFCVVWLGRSTFVSFHDVESIDAVGRSVRVRVASGRSMLLRVGVPPEDFSKDAAVEALDLYREVVENFTSFRKRAAEHGCTDDEDLVAADGYREGPFREQETWRKVDDPSAVPGERLRAAVTLREELGDDASPRIYEAAAFVANPPLRAAMEKVAQGAASRQQRTPVE